MLQSYEIPSKYVLPFRIVLSLLFILGIAIYIIIFTFLTAFLKFLSITAAAIILINPVYGFYILAFALPLFGDQQGSKLFLNILDIILLFIPLSWCVRLIRAEKLEFKKTPFDYWLLVFFIAVFFSLLKIVPELKQLYNSDSSFSAFMRGVFTWYATTYHWSLKHFFDLILSILLYYFIINTLTLSHFKKFIKYALISYIIAVFLGIIDYFNIISLNFFRPENKEILKFGYRRLCSLFGHSGWFAEYMILLIPFIFGFLYFGNKRNQLFSFILLALSFITLLLTYQRGQWLAFIISSIVLISMISILRIPNYITGLKITFKQFVTLLICITAFLLIISFVLYETNSSLMSRVDSIFNIADRKNYIFSGWLLYWLSPILGNGIGSHYSIYSITIPESYTRIYQSDFATGHNSYTHILVECGPFALISFLALLFLSVKINITTPRNPIRTDNRIYILGLTGAFIAFLVDGFSQYSFYIRIVGILFWIFLGFTVLFNSVIEPKPTTPSRYKKVLKYSFFAVFIMLSSLALLKNPGGKSGAYGWEKWGDNYWRYGKEESIYTSYLEGRRIIIPVLIPHADFALNPVQVFISMNDKHIQDLVFNDTVIKYFDYTIKEKLPFNIVRFKFKVDRVWIPSKYDSKSTDDRELGIAIGSPIWTDAVEDESTLLSLKNQKTKKLYESLDDNNFESWTYKYNIGKVLSLAAPYSKYGRIGVESKNNKNNYGYWHIKNNCFPTKDGYIYRTKVVLSSNQKDAGKVPDIAVGLMEKDNQIGSFYTISSPNNECVSPTKKPIEYTLYFFPNTLPAVPHTDKNSDTFYGTFSVLNHNPDDAENAKVFMSDFNVKEIPLTRLKKTGATYNDILDMSSNWEFSMPFKYAFSDKSQFGMLEYRHSPGCLALIPNDTQQSFGQYEKVTSLVPPKGTIYRARFFIYTSYSPQAAKPSILLKFGLEDDSLSSNFIINDYESFHYFPLFKLEYYPMIVGRYYDVYFQLPDTVESVKSRLKTTFEISQAKPKPSNPKLEVFLSKVTIDEFSIEN